MVPCPWLPGPDLPDMVYSETIELEKPTKKEREGETETGGQHI